MALMTLLLWQQFKHFLFAIGNGNEESRNERILNNKLIDVNQKEGLKHCNKVS
jgi:hypothetical protein